MNVNLSFCSLVAALLLCIPGVAIAAVRPAIPCRPYGITLPDWRSIRSMTASQVDHSTPLCILHLPKIGSHNPFFASVAFLGLRQEKRIKPGNSPRKPGLTRFQRVPRFRLFWAGGRDDQYENLSSCTLLKRCARRPPARSPRVYRRFRFIR